MSRVQLYKDILGIFGTSEWTTATSIKVIPQDYSGNPGAQEFIRPNIIVGNAAPLFSGTQSSGTIRFDIFTKAGLGPQRSVEIVDIISNFFERKVLSPTVQTFVGTLVPQGTDPQEPQYYRVNYAVPFNFTI